MLKKIKFSDLKRKNFFVSIFRFDFQKLLIQKREAIYVKAQDCLKRYFFGHYQITNSIHIRFDSNSWQVQIYPLSFDWICC
jgi:hypothetical protein